MSENKKWKKYVAIHKIYKAIIEEDLPDVGWQMYVYKNGIDIFDTVQTSLRFCTEVAFEEFGIPLDSWEEIKK